MTDQRHDWQFQGVQSDRPQYKCLRCDIGTMSPKQEMRRCEPMSDQLRGEREPMQRAIEAISQGAVNAWGRECQKPVPITNDVASELLTPRRRDDCAGILCDTCGQEGPCVSKAFVESVLEAHRPWQQQEDQREERQRLEQEVLLAARTLCSIRQDEPRLKFEPAYSKWLALHDEALSVLDNAVEAFEKAQEGGERVC